MCRPPTSGVTTIGPVGLSGWVEAPLAADRSDQALDVRVLPWRARCGPGGFDVHAGQGGRDRGERAIPIMHEIAWRLVFREGVPELLRDPAGGRVGRGVRMNDASSFMSQDDQHEQQPERDRRHDERNVGLSIGPSKTAGATSPSTRKPATTVCLPMAIWRVIPDAYAARTAPVAPQEIGGHARLVDEDVGPRVVHGRVSCQRRRSAATSGRRCSSACTVLPRKSSWRSRDLTDVTPERGQPS